MPSVLKESIGSGVKILGICLGHQAIGEAFGGQLINLPKVYHGIQTPITVVDKTDRLFAGLQEQINVGRYHSWAVDRSNFPTDQLTITATDEEGHIMAMRHNELPIYGVQFHPESVLTPDGNKMLENWLKI